jgi:hypothetical protein
VHIGDRVGSDLDFEHAESFCHACQGAVDEFVYWAGRESDVRGYDRFGSSEVLTEGYAELSCEQVVYGDVYCGFGTPIAGDGSPNLTQEADMVSGVASGYERGEGSLDAGPSTGDGLTRYLPHLWCLTKAAGSFVRDDLDGQGFDGGSSTERGHKWGVQRCRHVVRSNFRNDHAGRLPV